jgi:hypothetical protein
MDNSGRRKPVANIQIGGQTNVTKHGSRYHGQKIDKSVQLTAEIDGICPMMSHCVQQREEILEFQLFFFASEVVRYVYIFLESINYK